MTYQQDQFLSQLHGFFAVVNPSCGGHMLIVEAKLRMGILFSALSGFLRMLVTEQAGGGQHRLLLPLCPPGAPRALPTHETQPGENHFSSKVLFWVDLAGLQVIFKKDVFCICHSI